MTDDGSTGADDRHPLYLGVELPHRTEIPVLGLPVRFRSNDPRVLSHVDEVLGEWRAFRGTSADTLHRVDIVAHDGPEPTGAPGPGLTYRLPDRQRVVVTGRGSVGIADARRREVTAYVSEELLDDAGVFRHGFLQALILSLLAHADRFPVHAGAVASPEAALLLKGPSGVGKSTLTYAWMREGGCVLTDDAVYAQRQGGGGVWGMPGSLHLLENTTRFFPELKGREAVRLPNGKSKVPVSIRDAGGLPPRLVYRRYGLCLLERRTGDSGPRIERLTGPEVLAALRTHPEERMDAFAEEAPEVVAGLARDHPAWRLEVAGPPSASIPLLRDALESC